MNKSLPAWTQQDDAEYNRLATEMNEDSKTQFTLFTFSITASTAILGFLTSTAVASNAILLPGLPHGSFFLVPLIVLLPTSMLILNRARTRNRKAAYIIVNFDYKRLCAEGITNQTSLEEVRRSTFLPWETALHILDRTNPKVNRYVHLAPSLKYMAICYFVVEILCAALALYMTRQDSLYTLIGLGMAIAFVVIPVYRYRIKALVELKGSISIQGYVEQWLKLKYGTVDNAPMKYLSQWIQEFNPQEQQDVVRP